MSEQATLQALVARIVAQLAESLSSASNQPVRTLPAVGGDAVDWIVPLDVTGAVQATLTAGVGQDAAMRLAAVIIGSAQGYTDTELSDTLSALLSEATDAAAGEDLHVAVGTPVRTTVRPPAGAWQHDLVMGADAPPRFVVWTAGAPGESPGLPATSPPPVESAQVRASQPTVARPAMPAGPGREATPSARNLDVVLDLELPIMVRFGETQLTLDALARLGPGSMIDLERSPDDPVDLLVNGRLIARGEVVVVGGCYGVRVSEVVSAADRLRSLEG